MFNICNTPYQNRKKKNNKMKRKTKSNCVPFNHNVGELGLI